VGSPRSGERDGVGLVKLKLDLASFDERPFRRYVECCEEEGIQFATMSSLGDTDRERRKLYELNRECSRDIPGRGVFYSYDEYVKTRIAVAAYSPPGIVVALDEREWIGMSAISDWRSKGFMFNEMTGVRASHRGRGIATAMKVLGIGFARSTGARWLYTIHAARNLRAIRLNRRLGYVDADWEESLLDPL
jgi:RimJ/RimL family protein N-acetyltransferase